MSTACDHRVYVRRKDDGDLRVGEADLPLESPLAAYWEGSSPESIKSQYPALTFEEIYGGVAWMLGHPDETKAYVKRQEALWEKWRRYFESQPHPARDRIRTLLQARQERSQA